MVFTTGKQPLGTDIGRTRPAVAPAQFIPLLPHVGKVEIAKLGFVLRGQQNVAGLHVVVNDIVALQRELQPLRNHSQTLQKMRIGRERPGLEVLFQTAVLHETHDQKRLPVTASAVVDRNHTGMVQPRDQLSLPEKPIRDLLPVRTVGVQNLDRDPPREVRFDRTVDL